MGGRRTHFGSLSLSLSLSLCIGVAVPVLTPRISSAQETRNAFVWIEFASPNSGDFEGYVVDGVMDVNNEGRILGRVVDEGAGRGFVITNGHWAMLKPDTSTTVRDMNNDGVVVGWTGNVVGRGWIPEYSSDGSNLGTDVKVEGINDYDAYVGYDVDQQTPVGWLTATQGWVALPPLSGGDATAARGISNTSSNNYPLIVGNSIDTYQDVQRPVAWTYDGQDFTAHLLDATYATDTDVPYVVNDNGWIVGSVADGGSYNYLCWTPSGSNTWTRYELNESSGDPKAVGLNASNEIVADKTLFALAWGTTQTGYSLLDMVDLPTVAYATAEWYPTSNLSFRAINDKGWIVGKGVRTDGSTNTPVVILLVPYDMDNSGTPDYREIIANPTLDDDANWVLDKSEQMRVGLYAAGFNPEGTRADEVDDIQAVRLHLDDGFIHDIVHDVDDLCEGTQDALEAWRQSPDPQNPDQKEIIAMIRTKYSNPRYDYIMTGQTKEDYLDDLFCFAYRYARDIDFIQFGNEIYEGPGEYWINGEGLGGIDGEYLPAACDAVFAWIGEQMAVARMASALAGRPLRFIGPAATRRAIISGYGGNLLSEYLDMDDPEEDNPFRDAYNIKRLVEFANANHAYVDAHLHYNQDGQLEAALDYLVNPSENTWDTPIWRTCMEWSPVTTQDWAVDNNPTYRMYFWEYEGAPEELWDDYVDAWGTDGLNGGLGRTGFPDLDRDLTEAASYGLLHACYGEFNQGTIPTQQTAPNYPLPDQFDLTVLRAESVIADDEWITDYTNLWTAIRGALEEDNYSFRIGTFTPRPSSPNTSCGCVIRP